MKKLTLWSRPDSLVASLIWFMVVATLAIFWFVVMWIIFVLLVLPKLVSIFVR